MSTRPPPTRLVRAVPVHVRHPLAVAYANIMAAHARAAGRRFLWLPPRAAAALLNLTPTEAARAIRSRALPARLVGHRLELRVELQPGNEVEPTNEDDHGLAPVVVMLNRSPETAQVSGDVPSPDGPEPEARPCAVS